MSSKYECFRQGRARNKAARALESVLRLYADPIAKRLKVTSGLKAGGIDCNHARRVLAVSQ